MIQPKPIPILRHTHFPYIARIREGYSGADIENICREAGMQAIREKMEDFDVVKNKHFEFAMTKIKSTLPKNVIERYEQLAKQITESRNIQEGPAEFYK